MVTRSALASLMDPLQACDYVGVERMKLLLLSENGKPPLIRLLDARELFKYIAQEGRMKRRQDMEREHPEVYCSEEFVNKLLGDFRIDLEQQNRPVEKRFSQLPGVVMLSYAWTGGDADAPHPDPDGQQLKALPPVLEWWMSGRANRIVKAGKGHSKVKQEDAPCDASFGIFIDFMSLYQPPYAAGTAEEEAFGIVLFNIGLLYAHAKTALWQITATPTDDKARQFCQRGWCFLERRLLDLLSQRHCCLDISKFQDREAHEDFGIQRCTATSAFGTAAGARKTTEELAAQADQKNLFGGPWSFPTLEVMTRAARGPPLDDQGFAQEVRKLKFSDAHDLEVCCGIYARASGPVLREHMTVMEFRELAWSVREWELFVQTLARCESLASLSLSRMLTGCEARVLFKDAALTALARLDLDNNDKFGAAGCAALAAAIARGAMPRLAALSLESSAVTSALLEALPPHVLPHLTCLTLSRNDAAFGARGCAALASALLRGALPALRELDLAECQVNSALFAPLDAGALSALTRLDLLHSEHFGAAGSLALAGAVQRGAMPSLTELNLSRCGVTSALFQGLQAGAFSALSSLLLDHNATLGEAGSVALGGAVQRGAMRGLREVSLSYCGLTSALFLGVGAGALPALRKLELGCNLAFGDEGVSALCRAVEHGAMPLLQELAMPTCAVSALPFLALNAGALPALLQLALCDNAEVGDAGCGALAGAVLRGAMRELREVRLYACGVSEEGLDACACRSMRTSGSGSGSSSCGRERKKERRKSGREVVWPSCLRVVWCLQDGGGGGGGRTRGCWRRRREGGAKRCKRGAKRCKRGAKRCKRQVQLGVRRWKSQVQS